MSSVKYSKPGKQADGKKNWRENREKYFAEKAKPLKMPTEEAAELKPVFMFEDPIFIVHMCYKCRLLNRSMEVVKVDDEHQQFPLTLCKICRAHLNTQRRSKFFNHELLTFKREKEDTV